MVAAFELVVLALVVLLYPYPYPYPLYPFDVWVPRDETGIKNKDNAIHDVTPNGLTKYSIVS